MVTEDYCNTNHNAEAIEITSQVIANKVNLEKVTEGLYKYNKLHAKYQNMRRNSDKQHEKRIFLPTNHNNRDPDTQSTTSTTSTKLRTTKLQKARKSSSVILYNIKIVHINDKSRRVYIKRQCYLR